MSTMEDLHAVIANVEMDLQRELINGSGNPWLACFNTRITTFRVTLECCRVFDHPEKLHLQIDKLREKIHQVASQHGWEPPEEVMRSLLSDFRRLMDD